MRYLVYRMDGREERHRMRRNIQGITHWGATIGCGAENIFKVWTGIETGIGYYGKGGKCLKIENLV